LKSRLSMIFFTFFCLSIFSVFAEGEELFSKGKIETEFSGANFVAAEFKQEKSIDVVFSRHSHNRISWERGSIISITGDSTLFAVEINPKIGQAFVHVLRDLTVQPATLTVISSTGLVQDLLVRSLEKPSTHISIRESQEEEEDFTSTYVDFHTQTIEFLNDILENKIPFGYGQRSIQDSDKLSLPSPLEVKIIKALNGPFETIVIYHLTNMGRQSIRLNPNTLKRSEDSWVFLNARELDYREGTLCILAKPKEEV
jgi:hypothetical protein